MGKHKEIVPYEMENHVSLKTADLRLNLVEEQIKQHDFGPCINAVLKEKLAEVKKLQQKAKKARELYNSFQ